MLDGTQVLDWALPPAIEEGFQATLVPEETAISEPKQVGVIAVEGGEAGQQEFPLFLGCNVIGRAGPESAEGDTERARQLDVWRQELGPHVHVSGVFLPDPSISKTHVHIDLKEQGRVCEVTAQACTNPVRLLPGGDGAAADEEVLQWVLPLPHTTSPPGTGGIAISGGATAFAANTADSAAGVGTEAGGGGGVPGSVGVTGTAVSGAGDGAAAVFSPGTALVLVPGPGGTLIPVPVVGVGPAGAGLQLGAGMAAVAADTSAGMCAAAPAAMQLVYHPLLPPGPSAAPVAGATQDESGEDEDEDEDEEAPTHEPTQDEVALEPRNDARGLSEAGPPPLPPLAKATQQLLPAAQPPQTQQALGEHGDKGVEMEVEPHQEDEDAASDTTQPPEDALQEAPEAHGQAQELQPQPLPQLGALAGDAVGRTGAAAAPGAVAPTVTLGHDAHDAVLPGSGTGAEVGMDMGGAGPTTAAAGHLVEAGMAPAWHVPTRQAGAPHLQQHTQQHTQQLAVLPTQPLPATEVQTAAAAEDVVSDEAAVRLETAPGGGGIAEEPEAGERPVLWGLLLGDPSPGPSHVKPEPMSQIAAMGPAAAVGSPGGPGHVEAPPPMPQQPESAAEASAGTGLSGPQRQEAGEDEEEEQQQQQQAHAHAPSAAGSGHTAPEATLATAQSPAAEPEALGAAAAPAGDQPGAAGSGPGSGPDPAAAPTPFEPLSQAAAPRPPTPQEGGASLDGTQSSGGGWTAAVAAAHVGRLVSLLRPAAAAGSDAAGGAMLAAATPGPQPHTTPGRSHGPGPGQGLASPAPSGGGHSPSTSLRSFLPGAGTQAGVQELAVASRRRAKAPAQAASGGGLPKMARALRKAEWWRRLGSCRQWDRWPQQPASVAAPMEDAGPASGALAADGRPAAEREIERGGDATGKIADGAAPVVPPALAAPGGAGPSVDIAAAAEGVARDADMAQAAAVAEGQELPQRGGRQPAATAAAAAATPTEAGADGAAAEPMAAEQPEPQAGAAGRDRRNARARRTSAATAAAAVAAVKAEPTVQPSPGAAAAASLRALVRRLGGQVADDEDTVHFSHMVLPRYSFVPSLKVLSAIAAGRPLLDEVWLQGCRDAGGVWLEPQKQHAAVDPKQEKELRFSIWDAFERARRNGLLLQGRTFFTTPLRRGLSLVAQLAGARLLTDPGDVVPGHVYDKEVFKAMVLQQRLDGHEPLFTV
eukprot:XP_001691607.1 predicted protein [Chlamydomonas reinhardtii]